MEHDPDTRYPILEWYAEALVAFISLPPHLRARLLAQILQQIVPSSTSQRHWRYPDYSAIRIIGDLP